MHACCATTQQFNKSKLQYTVQCYTTLPQPLCPPVSVWTSSDVSTSYKLAARSQEAVTTWRPPTNQSAAITTPWWLFRVAVATRTVGTSQEPSPSTSPSSLSDESWSSSHGAYGRTDQSMQPEKYHLNWWAFQKSGFLSLTLTLRSSYVLLYDHALTWFRVKGDKSQNSMRFQDIPVETLWREQDKATHTDIWWRLGGGKLHHIAPDVSRLVPGGCANLNTH